MLEAIRKHAQGWLAKAILALIALTFAAFGLESYQSSDSSNGYVAEVGDVGISRDELTREIQAQSRRLREEMGPAFDPATVQTPEFQKQVLDGIIERKALLLDAQKQKLMASDAYVAAVLTSIPAFQEDGKFSQARYETILQQDGRRPVQFENEIRQSFMMEAIASPVALAAFSSKTSLDLITRLVAQQREVSWVDLPAASVADQIKISAEDIARDYAANKAAWTDPEQIRVEYLLLDLASVAAGITVSDQAVADYYAANASQFGQPEQRSASHILITADKNADTATRARAKAKAMALFQTLQKTPAKFAELARAESQDPGSAAQDGSLGSFGRGMMVKPFEDAVFSMKRNEIRGPIESDFGYHVIRLDSIQPAQIAPLATVRAAVVEELRKRQAQKVFADMADNFGNLVYENADSLASAAKTLKLTPQQSGWMSVKSAPPPFNHPALSAAVFSRESITSKQNTEAIELQPGMLIAARVIDHRAARLKPLAEVTQAIAARLRAEQTKQLLTRKGTETIKTLTQGTETGLNWSAFQVVARQPTDALDATAIKAVFQANTNKLPAYTGFTRGDGSYRIVRISRVLEAASLEPGLASSIQSSFVQAQQRGDMKALIDLIKAGQKIKIQDNAIETP